MLQFSVQDDHVHLIVEADDTQALRRGLRGLAIRVARAVNRALGRRGAVWGDRYHARALTSPRPVRHALVYVLMNLRKHHVGGRGMDPCSSAKFFDGWREPVRTESARAPVVRARTWLAAVGWRRHGLLGIDERPRELWQRDRGIRTRHWESCSRRFAGAERRAGRAAQEVRAAARVLSQAAVELSRFAAGWGAG